VCGKILKRINWGFNWRFRRLNMKALEREELGKLQIMWKFSLDEIVELL
jgi:hypothetical protein